MLQALSATPPTDLKARQDLQLETLIEPYLSGIMGNQRLTFSIILGLYRDYSTPKRLKVTYSTTRELLGLKNTGCGFGVPGFEQSLDARAQRKVPFKPSRCCTAWSNRKGWAFPNALFGSPKP